MTAADAAATEVGRSRDDRTAGVERIVWIIVAVLTVAVVVMVVVRAVTSDWVAAGDFIILRMRVSDVGTADTPVLGVYSRFGWNHPGPFLFYAFAPFLRMAGGAPYGLLLGALAVNGAAIAATLWLARRAGAAALAVFAAVLAVFVFSFGAEELFDPWNPYLPILPLVATGVAAWRCLDADRVAAVVLVVAASFSVQTHVGMVTMAVTMVAIGGFGIVRAAWGWGPRANADGRGDELRRRRARITGIIAFAVGAVCWIPPIVQQISPGSQKANLGEIVSFFRQDAEFVVGLGDAIRMASDLLVLPPRLGVGWTFEPSSRHFPWLSVILLGTTIWSWRIRWRAVRSLNVIAWCAIGGFVIGASRVSGTAWPYLFRWGWVAVVLVWGAILLTVLTAAGERWPASAGLGRIGAGVVAVLALCGTLVAGVDMTTLDTWERETSVHSALIGTALDAASDVTGPIHLVADGTMDGLVLDRLVSEAEDRRIDLRMARSEAFIFGEHRTIEPSSARTRLILAPSSRTDDLVASTGGRVVARDDDLVVILVVGGK